MKIHPLSTESSDNKFYNIIIHISITNKIKFRSLHLFNGQSIMIEDDSRVCGYKWYKLSEPNILLNKNGVLTYTYYAVEKN